jgi:RimJ/RimL family protein N-acetyltransferase
MPKEGLPIETVRLVLRRFRKTDLDGLMGYHALPESQRYLTARTRDRVEVESALEAMCNQHTLHRPGDTLSLAAVRGKSGVVVGQASLIWTDATAAQAELKLIISPNYRRRGFGTELARGMLDFGFGAMRFHRIFVRCGADNEAAVGMFRRLGLRLEAHYREHALFQGEWDEELHFATLDREWLRTEQVEDLFSHLAA